MPRPEAVRRSIPTYSYLTSNIFIAVRHYFPSMVGVRTVVADGPAVEREFTLVVALANPDRVGQLMRTALDVARSRDGEIVVVSVIHKATTSPFLLFSTETIEAQYAGEAKNVLESAVARAADDGVPVGRRLLVASDVSDAILSVLREVDADAVLLGWRDRPRASDIVLGTTIDPVIRRAPCDVYVERVGTTADGVDSILLPTVGGPHVAAAAALVTAIGRANDASATVGSYVPPDAGDAERSAAREHVRAAATHLEGIPVVRDVREADDVARHVVAAAADHDLVVLGATRERSFRRRVAGSVARTVARDAAPPVVIVKRGRERSLTSLLSWR